MGYKELYMGPDFTEEPPAKPPVPMGAGLSQARSWGVPEEQLLPDAEPSAAALESARKRGSVKTTGAKGELRVG